MKRDPVHRYELNWSFERIEPIESCADCSWRKFRAGGNGTTFPVCGITGKKLPVKSSLSRRPPGCPILDVEE